MTTRATLIDWTTAKNTLDRGRLAKCLDRQYRFSGHGILTLGQWLDRTPITRKSAATRTHETRRRELEYKKLAQPITEYTAWYLDATHGELGIDVPKIVYDAIQIVPQPAPESNAEARQEQHQLFDDVPALPLFSGTPIPARDPGRFDPPAVGQQTSFLDLRQQFGQKG